MDRIGWRRIVKELGRGAMGADGPTLDEVLSASLGDLGLPGELL